MVVQVVTDTCSVMKAAWKLVETKFPWITCTCCGPHVLNLYLKDLGKIEEVAAVIKKSNAILNLFWGKKRWPRTKLREVIAVNHKKEFGLYRPKATRFAGNMRALGRMLRVKADLQQVVVSSEFGEQKFKKGNDDDTASGTISGREHPVKAIILDESGFWAPLVEVLKIATPVVKLLRLCDGAAPAMGKVMPRMNSIRGVIANSTVPWKEAALKIHDARWEYLKSPMHLAGYALDPEYLAHERRRPGGALISTIEKMAMRYEYSRLTSNPDSLSGPMLARKLTVDDPGVQRLAGEACVELASYHDSAGVLSRPFVKDQAKTLPPAHWWSMYGKNLPALSKVACTVLSQPVCASAAERNWSIYGSIKTDRRNRMRHSVSNRLVYCHEALQLRIKRTKAGYPHRAEPRSTSS